VHFIPSDKPWSNERRLQQRQKRPNFDEEVEPPNNPNKDSPENVQQA
jgi:hypothetical protein